MASFSIKYIFQMVDQFTGPASKLGQAAAAMSKQVGSAGAAADQMAAKSSRIAGAMGAVVSAVNSAASAIGNYISQMAKAAAIKPLAPPVGGQGPKGAAWSIAQRNAAEAAAKKSDGGGTFVGIGGKMTNLAASYWLGKQVLHGADSLISKAADVDTMRRKLEFAWGGGAEGKSRADAAVAKATELSNAYKNTTIAENLHIVDDLRANLPEHAEEIIAHTVEPFVKLHSFFKGWQGGKHAGNVSQSLKDIGIAIRSGELGGNVTGEMIKAWAEQLAVSRAWFGEKFKLDEFFKAQKAARYSLPGTSDRFKSIVFPAMVQSMGVGAGVASATAFNKIVGGITVHQATAEAWRELGLVDMTKVRLKKGKIDPASLTGNKHWIKGGGLYATDPDYFVTQELLPALARKGGVKGLTPQVAEKIKTAYAASDAETLAKLLPTFVKDPSLIKALAPLGKDRNAVQEFYMMIERLASFARDAEGMKKIAEGKGEYDGYDVAKQRVSASADRLINSIAGTDGIGIVNKALDALSGFMDIAADQIKKFNSDQKMQESVKNGTLAIELLDRFMNPPLRPNGSEGMDFSNFGLDGPTSLLTNENAIRVNKALAEKRTPFDNFLRMDEREVPESFRNRYIPRWAHINPDAPSDPYSWEGRSFGAAAASAIPQSMSVHVDPIQVNLPPSVRLDVNVTGQVNGPISGSGSGELPLSAQQSRGTATPDAGPPSGRTMD